MEGIEKQKRQSNIDGGCIERVLMAVESGGKQERQPSMVDGGRVYRKGVDGYGGH